MASLPTLNQDWNMLRISLFVEKLAQRRRDAESPSQELENGILDSFLQLQL